MKITRFFSWSEKEKELKEEMINLAGVLTIYINHPAGYLVHNNEKIYQIIIVSLRIPNQFAIYKCCEQIQIGLTEGGTWTHGHMDRIAL